MSAPASLGRQLSANFTEEWVDTIEPAPVPLELVNYTELRSVKYHKEWWINPNDKKDWRPIFESETLIDEDGEKSRDETTYEFYENYNQPYTTTTIKYLRPKMLPGYGDDTPSSMVKESEEIFTILRFGVYDQYNETEKLVSANLLYTTIRDERTGQTKQVQPQRLKPAMKNDTIQTAQASSDTHLTFQRIAWGTVSRELIYYFKGDSNNLLIKKTIHYDYMRGLVDTKSEIIPIEEVSISSEISKPNPPSLTGYATDNGDMLHAYPKNAVISDGKETLQRIKGCNFYKAERKTTDSENDPSGYTQINNEVVILELTKQKIFSKFVAFLDKDGLTPGSHYYYVATTVDNFDNESDYSNEIDLTSVFDSSAARDAGGGDDYEPSTDNVPNSDNTWADTSIGLSNKYEADPFYHIKNDDGADVEVDRRKSRFEFFDESSIATHGVRPAMTISDESITNITQAKVVRDAVFGDSGKETIQLNITPAIYIPGLKIGQYIKIASGNYTLVGPTGSVSTVTLPTTIYRCVGYDFEYNESGVITRSINLSSL